LEGTAGVAQKAAREVAGDVRARLPAVAAAQHQVATAASRQREARTAIEHADLEHMRRALELAEQYRGRTAPNPIVGCVIVDARGDVIAEGVHRGPGTKHAEIDALDQLGGTAAGATLYVNLEPCMHQGRTAPCAPILAAAKLARIVVGSLDPIAAHAGGAKRLAKLGIPVSRLLVEECDLANLPFATASLSRQAAFTLKAAVTLDGKISTVGGESRWITGDAAREQVHRLRSTHDAVLVGIGTVLADDPELTARVDGGRDPVRIVIDSRLRTPVSAKFLPRKQGPRTIIATTETSPEANARALADAGAEIWRFPATRGQVSLGALAYQLVEENLYSVLVEGGGQIHASLLAEGLATELQLFVAPRIVGGPAPSWIGGAGVTKLRDAWQLQFVGEPRRFGDDLLVRAVVRYRLG
jgi:diaminohydroxyphosphoribosylaminopyrimidine deaminase/5-amino-6-(5-phosphoribosylamino)uracil reductase